MKICKGICTRFLTQIKKKKGPMGGTWNHLAKIDMDPEVYNFRVINNTFSRLDIMDYHQCSKCDILYHKDFQSRICLCCSNHLTLRHNRSRGGRKGEEKREGRIAKQKTIVLRIKR